MDDFRKNGKKKEKLSEHFWERLNEFQNRIRSVHRYCIDSVYAFKVGVRK